MGLKFFAEKFIGFKMFGGSLFTEGIMYGHFMGEITQYYIM